MRDPYEVLGVSRDASEETIKAAYRTLTKQYHPDLYAEDSDAAEKMKEINDAYEEIKKERLEQNSQSVEATADETSTDYSQEDSEAVEDAASAPADAADTEAVDNSPDAGETADSGEADTPEDEAENGDDEPEGDASEEDGESEDAEQAPAPEKPKKKSKLTALLVAAICVLAAVVVCLTIALTTAGGSESLGQRISAAIERRNLHGDAIAVNVLDADGNTVDTLTNTEFNYYYWGEYYYYLQNNGAMFDASLPLDEQSYDDTQTWQDYFIECAKTSLIQVVSLKQEAEAANFEMPDEYQSEYDATISSLESYALQAGFTDSEGNGDTLAYIRDSYGEASTLESFEEYLYDSYYVTAYSDYIYNNLSYTDDEVESYYDDNTDLFTSSGIEKSDVANADVRHILIQPESSTADEESSAEEEEIDEYGYTEKSWEDAEEKAKEILQEWEDGDATEESFAALAEEYSEDPGSASNGGLYEDVYPGEMVEEFNDWVFDPDREPGDTGIVKTQYGYHIMYFVGRTDTYYWRTVAEQQLKYSDYQSVIADLTAKYTAEITDDMILADPDAVRQIREDAAAEAEAAAASAAAESSTAEDSAGESSAGE